MSEVLAYKFSKHGTYDPYAYATDHTNYRRELNKVQSPLGWEQQKKQLNSIQDSMASLINAVSGKDRVSELAKKQDRSTERNASVNHLFNILLQKYDVPSNGTIAFNNTSVIPDNVAVYMGLIAGDGKEADAFKKAIINSDRYRGLSANGKARFWTNMATVWPIYLKSDKVGLNRSGNPLAGHATRYNKDTGNNAVTKPAIAKHYADNYLYKGLTPIFTDVTTEGLKNLAQDNAAYTYMFDTKGINTLADNFVAELKKAKENPQYKPNAYIMAQTAMLYHHHPDAKKIINSKVGGFLTEDPAAVQGNIDFFSKFNPTVDTNTLSQAQKIRLYLASRGALDPSNANQQANHGAAVALSMSSGMRTAMPGFITDKFANDENFRNHFVTDDYRTNIMNTTLGQFNGYLDKTEGFKWDYNNLIAHTALYNNDPAYRKMFDDAFGTAIGGRINENTTPQQMQKLMSDLNGIALDDKEMGAAVQALHGNPAKALPILAALKGNMDQDVDVMQSTVIAGHRAAGTAGAINAFKKHGLFWNSPREWIAFAHRNKIGNVPDWFGNLAQNREAFWGTLIGGGALVVGGLSLLVSSFLNSQKDEEEEELTNGYGNGLQRQRNTPNKQSQYNRLLNSTSMWRSV